MAHLSKKEQALEIYNEVVSAQKGIRRQVIDKLVAKCGMTPGAASTYYANIKKGAWDVKASPAAKGSTRRRSRAETVQ